MENAGVSEKNAGDSVTEMISDLFKTKCNNIYMVNGRKLKIKCIHILENKYFQINENLK